MIPPTIITTFPSNEVYLYVPRFPYVLSIPDVSRVSQETVASMFRGGGTHHEKLQMNTD